MEMISDILLGIFSFHSLLFLFLGTTLGIFFGAMPGLNGSICVAILLPITYGLDMDVSLLMLGAIYMGATFGGSISGILLNVPGTSEAACTAIEGNAMARAGHGRKALYLSINASTVGGLLGVMSMILLTPPLAAFALQFGPPEMFLVALSGLAVVGSLAGKSLAKGIFAVTFGIGLSLIGPDYLTGASRMIFGIKKLNGGISLIPAIVGFFAITEMVKQYQQLKNPKEATTQKFELEVIRARSVWKTVFAHPFLLAKSVLIGIVVGILPGTGGAIASFVAYGEAKRTTKSDTPFGCGNEDGIVAAESSNNAAVGGSLVPMLALGIPGSPTAAIMYGALLIHGVTPGPKLFTENADVTYTFMFGMLLAVIMMGLVGVYCVPLFSKVLKVKVEYLIPIVLACSLVGAYSSRNSVYDMLVAVACGALGVLFSKHDIPTSPVILGLILGNLVEINLRHTISITASKGISLISYISDRPLCLAILGIFAFFLLTSIFNKVRSRKKVATN